jgi:hypothetical protein
MNVSKQDENFKEVITDKVLEEDIDINIVTSLMRNYRNAVEAILELIDNAVDDRRDGILLKIEIFLADKFIQIINFGGLGMGLKELQAFLKWGRSSKRGKLGRYGQGGKAAMGYLGNSWKLQSSRTGDEKTYIIEEDNWRDRSGGKKKYKPKIFLGMTPKEEGIVRIEIRKLSRKINEKKLKEALSDYYRMLLEENKIKIEINGNSIKPLGVPLVEQQRFSEIIDSKNKFHGWMGLLKPNTSFRGGIRCCVLGRRITENEYFDQPDYRDKASLNKLIGEINVDFLELNLNKTGFDTDSWGWQKVKEKMTVRMQPYIDFLLNEKEEEQVTNDERKIHEEASKIWRDFWRHYLREKEKPLSELLNKIDLDEGQKPFETQGPLKGIEKVIVPKGSKYQPATPPPEDAIGRRKRLKKFLGIEAQPGIIPDITIRHEIKKIKDGKKLKEIIIINKKFPAYKRRKGDILYIWETIAMECAKPDKDEDMDHSEYIKEVNKIYSSFCLYLEKNKIKI